MKIIKHCFSMSVLMAFLCRTVWRVPEWLYHSQGSQESISRDVTLNRDLNKVKVKFYRLKVQNSSGLIQLNQCVFRAAFLSGSSIGEPIALPFSSIWKLSTFLAHGLLPSSKPAVLQLSVPLFKLHVPLTSWERRFSDFKDLCDQIGLIQIIKNNLPISRAITLTHLQSPCLSQKVTYSEVPGSRVQTCLGKHHSAYYIWSDWPKKQVAGYSEVRGNGKR